MRPLGLQQSRQQLVLPLGHQVAVQLQLFYARPLGLEQRGHCLARVLVVGDVEDLQLRDGPGEQQSHCPVLEAVADYMHSHEHRQSWRSWGHFQATSSSAPRLLRQFSSSCDASTEIEALQLAQVQLLQVFEPVARYRVFVCMHLAVLSSSSRSCQRAPLRKPSDSSLSLLQPA